MEIMSQNLHVNQTNFHIKDFVLGFALKQRQNATRKLPIGILVRWSLNRGGHLREMVAYKRWSLREVSLYQVKQTKQWNSSM